jgi:hypothetical protein
MLMVIESHGVSSTLGESTSFEQWLNETGSKIAMLHAVHRCRSM